MAYAANNGKNAGSLGLTDNFGGNRVETSGEVNAGTLKVAGLSQLGGAQTTYTLTYSTATATVPNATYAAPTQTANTVTFGTNVAAKTPALLLSDAVNTNAGTVATSLDQAQKDLGTAINTANTSLASTNTKLAALAVDALELKKLIVQLVADLKTQGLAL